jgi:hypothetical protein
MEHFQSQGVSMPAHRFNWPIWAGFLLSVGAFLSYFFVFVQLPVTRDFPWANLLLFGVAAVLLVGGVRRAFAPERPKRARIMGAVLAILSVAICGVFVFTTFIMARRLPTSHSTPQIGQKAPDFRLSDTHGTLVSLAEIISLPINGKAPKGVLLVFYRGA